MGSHLVTKMENSEWRQSLRAEVASQETWFILLKTVFCDLVGAVFWPLLTKKAFLGMICYFWTYFWGGCFFFSWL